MKPARALSLIEKHGILLVYPIQNRPEPRSLWSELHGGAPMRWEWDQEGDTRVHDLWHLREHLARSMKVVYSKWYQGRATFFSRDVFRAMLATRLRDADPHHGLPPTSQRLLEVLEDDSPVSTKELKRRAELQGRANEAAFTRGMGALWTRLLAVGAGEVDDGAFPSLAVGATPLMFEDLWLAAGQLRAEDTALLERTFARAPLFGRAFQKGNPAQAR
jgi:hypothetical protein